MLLKARLFAAQNILQIAITLSVFVGIVSLTGVIAFGLNPRVGFTPASRVAGISTESAQIAVSAAEKGRYFELVDLNHDYKNQKITTIYKIDRLLIGETTMPFLNISNLTPNQKNISVEGSYQTNVEDLLDISVFVPSSDAGSQITLNEEGILDSYLRINSTQDIHFPFTITVTAGY